MGGTINPNKMFSRATIPGSSIVAHSRFNREYLITSSTADELNTYRTWNIFPVANDAYVGERDENGKLIKITESGAPGVRSIFNKSGAVMIGGSDPKGYSITSDTSEWRALNNVPLMDSPENRKKIRNMSDCSIKALVKASEEGVLGQETYNYSDFMYCKHLGKISNNYLITLRRFPLPVDDFISYMGDPANSINTNLLSQNSVSIGCMVTWMGTPGNEMSNILKYSYKMPFTFKTAQWEDAGGNDYDSGKGILNAVAAAFDPAYRKAYQKGEVGGIFNEYIGKHFKASNYFKDSKFGKYVEDFEVGEPHYNLSDIQRWQDSNKVYGPVDTIKGTFMRDTTGLEFDQSITLQFDYELRSYNGINPRQAMLDLISNILNVTYTTGTFWGGGYRGHGAGQSNIFTNLNIFKEDGGFGGFVNAFGKDLQSGWKGIKSEWDSLQGGNFLETAVNIAKAALGGLNQLGGMILGGALNKLGRPAKSMVNSLLSPAPVGFWHLTIGNPHHPIMSIGNMVIKNTTIEHYGPLGLDDFPTGLKVTVELERGKPRDIRDIEKLYMHGNDRIYSSMGDEIKVMYEHAKEYKGIRTKTVRKTATTDEIKDSTNTNDIITKSELQDMSLVWKKYFGTDNIESIKIASMEQENGSQKKLSPTASGDSRQKGTGSR